MAAVINHLLQRTPGSLAAAAVLPRPTQFVQLQISGGKLRTLGTRIVTSE